MFVLLLALHDPKDSLRDTAACSAARSYKMYLLDQFSVGDRLLSNLTLNCRGRTQVWLHRANICLLIKDFFCTDDDVAVGWKSNLSRQFDVCLCTV